MEKTIIFDLDNTLIHTNSLYSRFRNMAVDYIAALSGAPHQEIHVWQKAHDRELFGTLGYTTARFPESCVAALRRFYPNRTQAQEAYVRQLGARVFDHTAPLHPGAEELVDALSPLCRLILFTQGDRDVQRNRVNALPFRHHFTHVEIVEHKTVATYHSLVTNLALCPQNCLMVGDSLKSDVIPAHKAGMKALHVTDHPTWELETEGHNLPEGCHKAANLAEASTILHTWLNL